MPQVVTSCLVEAQRGDGEDRVAIVADPRGTTLALADGAGGRAGGALAADLATSLAARLLRESDGANLPAVIAQVDRALEANPEAGETTLVAIRILGARVLGTSAGDSGAWLITPDVLLDLTANQLRKPMIGSGVTLGTVFEAEMGDATLLAASDGLFKYASRSTICRVVREDSDLEVIARRLVNSVRLLSGELQDDVSMILARMRH